MVGKAKRVLDTGEGMEGEDGRWYGRRRDNESREEIVKERRWFRRKRDSSEERRGDG